MPLTSAQLATLKAAIAANTATIPAGQPWTGGYAGQAINALPNGGDANAAIAGWYNLPASPAWTVWRDLPMEAVLNTITFANMTPADSVPANPDLAVQVWIARSLSCQGKQFNLQNLINGRTMAPMRKSNYRAALQDCLTNIPAGASGALLAANWVGVRDGSKSSATNAEKLLQVPGGLGTAGAPSDLTYDQTYDGPITGADVEAARNLP
jgi:hypothetical protein